MSRKNTSRLDQLVSHFWFDVLGRRINDFWIFDDFLAFNVDLLTAMFQPFWDFAQSCIRPLALCEFTSRCQARGAWHMLSFMVFICLENMGAVFSVLQ